MAETRQTFAGLSHGEIALWYALTALSTLVFIVGCTLLIYKYLQSRRGGRHVHFGAALRALWSVASHNGIRRRDPVAGLAHAAVFYGFSVLFLGTAILAFEDDFTKPVFGWTFWHGGFYLGYSLFLDVFGFALLVGLTVLAVKRATRPFRLDYRRVDGAPESAARRRYPAGDWILLGSLLFLGASGFLLEALRIAETVPPFEKWSPVGWTVAKGMREIGVTPHTAANAHFALWWLHGVAALSFVAAIPYGKALHMLAGPTNLVVRAPDAGRRMPTTDPTQPIGYSTIAELPARHLIGLDACTRCGKCHEACPATASGLPLSPRDLILDLRDMASKEIRSPHGVKSLDHKISPETLWSCMQCMACVEICPVGIEHVPIIVEARRALVDRGEFDGQAQQTLETIYSSGNSFGESRRKRSSWTADLGWEVKDARREPVDILWFVGDYASYDPRNRIATRALATVLHAAEVDFGILYESERNSGNDVRRLGEEGLFLDLAESNIDAISQCTFNRILTSDPHSYNTLKNEYPEFGGDWIVMHHSQLLLELLTSGALRPQRRLERRLTYHDPCALGRYNGVYEEPRRVLEAIGCHLVEMPRNRDNSFCCGAGGGRIWMKEPQPNPGERPAEARIREAVALDQIENFVVCCPKDVTMYEDAIRTTGHAESISLAELSELVLESLAQPPRSTGSPQSIS